MDDKKIEDIKVILSKWNPLGERAKEVSGLNDYEIEAIDIISSISLYRDGVKKAVKTVLEQAFSISLDSKELEQYSKQIESAL